jgi:hypothetical protein
MPMRDGYNPRPLGTRPAPPPTPPAPPSPCSAPSDHAIADRAREELARLEAEVAECERGAGTNIYNSRRDLLKRIIDGEGL